MIKKLFLRHVSKPRVRPINSQHNNFKWGNIFAGICTLVNLNGTNTLAYFLWSAPRKRPIQRVAYCAIGNLFSLCWVSLCWASLCWASLCWASLSWVSLCWVPVCWVTHCAIGHLFFEPKSRHPHVHLKSCFANYFQMVLLLLLRTIHINFSYVIG